MDYSFNKFRNFCRFRNKNCKVYELCEENICELWNYLNKVLEHIEDMYGEEIVNSFIYSDDFTSFLWYYMNNFNYVISKDADYWSEYIVSRLN